MQKKNPLRSDRFLRAKFDHRWGRAFAIYRDKCVAVLSPFHIRHLTHRRKRGPKAHSRPEAVRRFQRSGYIGFA